MSLPNKQLTAQSYKEFTDWLNTYHPGGMEEMGRVIRGMLGATAIGAPA